MASPLQLIVGLGNPGPRYAATRHNAGFQFLDAILADVGATLRYEARFTGRVGQGAVNGQSVRLLAPETFMNRSGTAVASMARFYKVAPEQMLIVHDELDLPPGTVRLKRGGGHGGHNGLRDIVDRLGSTDFVRLRIGIGRPDSSDQVIDYVLHPPTEAERRLIDDAIRLSRAEVPSIVRGELERAMNVLHARDSGTTAGPAGD